MAYSVFLVLCLLAVGESRDEPSAGAAVELTRTRLSVPQEADPATQGETKVFVNKTSGEIVMVAPETPGKTVVMECPKGQGLELMCQGVGVNATSEHSQKSCNGHCKARSGSCTPDRCFYGCLKIKCKAHHPFVNNERNINWCKLNCLNSFRGCPSNARIRCDCSMNLPCFCPLPLRL